MSAPSVPASWGAGRWALAVAFLFILQVGLLMGTAERTRPDVQRTRARTHFHLVPETLTTEQWSMAFFASIPNLFAGGGEHAFAGTAWNQSSTINYDLPPRREAPRWLDLDPARLQTASPGSGGPLVPFDLAEVDPVERFADAPLAALPQTPSAVHFDGGLLARLLSTLGDLPAWTNGEPLRQTTIELAVDGRGQVVSALAASRSGLAAADDLALGRVWRLRFRPTGPAAAASLMWGKASFTWQTVPPAAPPPATPNPPTQ